MSGHYTFDRTVLEKIWCVVIVELDCLDDILSKLYAYCNIVIPAAVPLRGYIYFRFTGSLVSPLTPPECHHSPPLECHHSSHPSVTTQPHPSVTTQPHSSVTTQPHPSVTTQPHPSVTTHPHSSVTIHPTRVSPLIPSEGHHSAPPECHHSARLIARTKNAARHEVLF